MPAPIERNVAIGGISLYPRYRGEKNMPDKESRGRGKDDDTPEKNTKAKGKEKARTEKKGSGEDEQRRRLEDLQREAEEARESSERTLREATSSVDPDQVEQVLKKLRESGQLRDIPIDKAAADAQLGVARGAYEGKGENADVVLETEVGSNQVGIYRDRGKMVLTGLPDTKYKSEVLAKLFKEAGIAKKIEFPKGFNEWTVEKRQEYVAENFGVKTIDNELLGYAPTPDPITPLPSMTGDLGIFERDMKKAIIIGELPNSLERLRRIEQDLDKAVREASLKDADRDVMINPDTDEDVILVRDALRQSIEVLEEELNTKTDEDRKSREEEILRDRGEINFDEHFGNHYKNTREAVLRRDRATLRDIMVDAKKEVEKLNNLPTSGPNKFDIDKEETWPEDIDVRKVFEVTRALKQQAAGLRRITLEQIMGGDGPDFDLLREFITENREVNLLEQVNKFYRNIYANLTPARRRALVGRIDDNAATATSSISGGWSEFNHRMKQLFDVVEGSRQMELVDDELRLTRAGRFQEWRGLTQIAGVEQAVEFAQLMQPPPDWEDTPVAVNKLIAAYESSGLTAQDLQPVISAGFGMLARINQNTEHGRGMYAELKEQLEAFKFKQAEIITAHVKSMDPEALGHVYESEMEGTLEVTQVAMISRFERDANGRRLYTKERDVSKEVNLFDTAKKIYSERLRDERIRMNMVEELTKYSISSLSESDKDEMRESVGYKYLSAEWQARWDSELASIRDWLEQRMNRLVNPIDSATGLVDFAKRKVNKDWFDTSDDPNADNATLSNPALWKSVRWAKGKMRGSLTKRTIQDWYERKTLHGAFGEVKEDGLDELFGTFEKDGSYKKGELTDLFRDLGDTDDKKLIERLREQFGNGQSWLQVRRAEMRRRIFKELKNMNLQYDANVHYGKHGVRGGDLKKMTDEDFEYLMDTGYMSSLETNAFDRSWLLEWSTYSFIHIYGENNKRSDNYQALVYNKSSDLYNAWIVDHNWEYLHPDFEDRGRGRADDVNDVFRQYYPGKYKWLFGHVNVTTRFIENFLTEDGKKHVEERKKELLREHYKKNGEFIGPYKDDFEEYMKGVARRELIVSGAISFADKNYSEVVRRRDTFNKFNPIDNADDRKRVKQFLGAGAFQDYLANPESAKFQELISKDKLFMSTRNPRLFPWMEFGLKAHWEVVHKLKHKFFGEPDITNDEMENFVENLVAGGDLEQEQGSRFVKKNLGLGTGILGTAFFRNIRSLFEAEKKESQVQRKPLWLRLIILFLWTIPVATAVGLTKGAGEEFKKQQH